MILRAFGRMSALMLAWFMASIEVGERLPADLEQPLDTRERLGRFMTARSIRRSVWALRCRRLSLGAPCGDYPRAIPKRKFRVATMDDTIEELSTLPPEVLVAIASGLLPVEGLADETWQSWRAALFFAAASQLTHAALLEAARERMPVAVGTADMGAAAFAAHIGALLCGGGRSAWQLVRPLRAVRAQTSTTTPLQVTPRLAGATLCAVAPSRLCLFGGRDSASGDTLDATHLAQIRGGVAIWDVLLAGGQVR